MQKFLVKSVAAAAVMIALPTAPAMAQATRTWVSGVGDDVNPCSRTAPCKTFAGAISKTAAGGEINVLDPGGFGGVTITKSITISSIGFEAGVLVSGTNAVNINAGVNDRVVLLGLDIEGLTTGLNGVNILQAGDVLIENCYIHRFQGASAGNGVMINTTQPVRVTIKNSTIVSNLTGVNVNSTSGMGHAFVFGSLLTDNSGSGIRVNTGNDATIQGNQIVGSPAALVIKPGASVISYGGNLLPNGPAPTSTLPLQ